MKIVFALSRFPLPTDKGDKLRAFYQIRFLAQRHEVHLVCLNDGNIRAEDRKTLEKLCASIEVIPLGKLQKGLNLLRGLFNALPFQVNYFRSARMKKVLDEKIRGIGADVCFVQLIRLAPNIPFIKGTGYFLDYMDAFSVGMENRLPLSPWYMKPFVRMETRRLKVFEGKVAVNYDALGIISEQDAAALPPVLREEVHVLRNGVGEQFFESLPEEKKVYDLLFTGNLGYHPNEQGALFLVEEILPELEKLGVKASVCLAGARPTPALKALASDRIAVTGRVPDLRTYFQRSRVYVAPLISGQGLQNKLLESMAMGLPTVTSPGPNAALGAKAGVEIAVAESAAGFARQIKKLLENADHAQELAEAGHAFVRKYYRWEEANKLLENILLKTKGGLRP